MTDSARSIIDREVEPPLRQFAATLRGLVDKADPALGGLADSRSHGGVIRLHDVVRDPLLGEVTVTE